MTDQDGPAVVALVGGFVVLPAAVLFCAHKWGFTSVSEFGAELAVRVFTGPRTSIVGGAVLGGFAGHAVYELLKVGCRGSVPVLPPETSPQLRVPT